MQAIRHWRLVEGSYVGLDVAGPATWFVDPPYQGMGRHYTHGAAGIDFGHLAGWCRGREGQVIVCEASGATWLPFEHMATLRTTRKGRPAAEAVWTNERQLSLWAAERP